MDLCHRIFGLAMRPDTTGVLVGVAVQQAIGPVRVAEVILNRLVEARYGLE